ncbi:FAD-dependent oxidoreductase [Candidatus Formimonas warabiya]|uniref:dihydrouracil dehydrogenase (NAD(+)) n=1 Tax=Formimonas warabiya TaxID=1761012 RepID=A0A3G1KTT4_FORW1|nr:FAD-dependent oxidoreductase [Candidatus Formimonas warabiya]ATW25837.1 dihydroorotate dehydrogenase [Candidatus Formimonas warabiya]
MIDFKKLKGADLATELCGLKLQSPFILSSGPLSYAAEGMIKAYQAGCGAVVTKTIRHHAAVNPVHHIGKINRDSLINCEKWADSPPEVWFNREIPMAKKAGVVVIASVGHTLPEAEDLVKPCADAGADLIELVSYAEETLLPMLGATLERVKIPVLCKLSGNWPDPVATAKKCLEFGAAGITAIDSLGPTLKIDIKKAKPEMMGEGGYGWLSGGAMRPIALRINSEIARGGCPNLVGTGGITCAEDAIEYLMVGCNAVGVHSIAVLKGIEYFEKLNKDTAALLEHLGYKDIRSVRGVALPNFPKEDIVAKLKFHYEPDLPPCQEACPAGVDVPLYIDQVRRGHYLDAYKTISADNPFPGICGRVCHHPCEIKCRRAQVDQALHIRLLKRTAADKTYESCGSSLPLSPMRPKNGKKVAIAGAGPAGLSAAYYLTRLGYQVKVFEALPVAGGMLAVGIPDYRLPQEILKREITRIENMGVEIQTGTALGQDITMEEIKAQGYESILIAVGAHKDPELKIPGADLAGVLSGIRFLRDVNLGRAGGLHGKKVAVIGGGNVALDAARSALRLGAGKVTVVYRRQREDMPATCEEVAYAEEEGVKFRFLAGPNRIEAAGKGYQLFYDPMQPGEVDGSGRRKPVPTGEEPVPLDADLIVIATGQNIDLSVLGRYHRGDLAEATKGIFFAGDCTTGPASVIEAVAAGKKAACEIDRFLGGEGKVEEENSSPRMHFVEVAEDDTIREKSLILPVEKRLPGFGEVESGLSEEAGRKEAMRCLHCGCINCGRCVAACAYQARALHYPEMTVNEELCRSCGLCVSVCPTGALRAEIVD